MYDSYGNYTPTYDSASSADPAVAAVIVVVAVIVAIVAYVVTAIFLGMIFKKAGVESWKAWIPVYNTWVMLELGDKPGWIALLSLLGFIPILGLVASIVAAVFLYIAMYQIGLKFGKSGAFVLLAIFLPIVWMIWLAVDKTAVWRGGNSAAQAVPAGPANVSAPVATPSENQQDNQQPPATPPAA